MPAGCRICTGAREGAQIRTGAPPKAPQPSAATARPRAPLIVRTPSSRQQAGPKLLLQTEQLTSSPLQPGSGQLSPGPPKTALHPFSGSPGPVRMTTARLLPGKNLSTSSRRTQASTTTTPCRGVLFPGHLAQGGPAHPAARRLRSPLLHADHSCSIHHTSPAHPLRTKHSAPRHLGDIGPGHRGSAGTPASHPRTLILSWFYHTYTDCASCTNRAQ